MRQHSAVDTADAEVDRAQPFRDAVAIEPLGEGRYGAELGPLWTVGTKAHGGLLLALLTRAGLARLDADAPGAAPDPLAIAADFLRAPDPGPVELRTEVLKAGRTASVVAVRMTQGDRPMLAATVTAGRLPADEPQWADLPDLAPEPTADATDPGADGRVFGLASACDLRLDESTAAFRRGEQAPPVLRGWVRPRGEPADVLFALLAGDILPPTVFNVGGRFGWAPTVQLTALLRAHPAPGWLRLESRSTVVAGTWFDEDVAVVDAAGRLVCQARQLALAPLQR
ncbi:thioesterase family protein [Pseudonocardia nigra]|uniref:thioesterase family protein n=1 Tax=Pseudonocardia nigra TaxID=1921578 RepID=UPI001C5F92E2|nr:thioesterase family protein [Pseudonocardia nigra]